MKSDEYDRFSAEDGEVHESQSFLGKTAQSTSRKDGRVRLLLWISGALNMLLVVIIAFQQRPVARLQSTSRSFDTGFATDFGMIFQASFQGTGTDISQSLPGPQLMWSKPDSLEGSNMTKTAHCTA